ncbi:hypothetical protein L6164_023650 [Bauhinia variegata]|uniref:Uncharacterized protein n=1 Tax=Bauhinia variegata TaxID=167791 RepID=A0ACB9MKA2_BAUVA|nr:hypothetical protein L6164_023650 [Bauhinia variegata]
MVMWRSQSQTGILLLWILCDITYNSTICIWSFKVQCNKMDRQKLLSFKQEVIDSSGMLSTWSAKQDCYERAGVECITSHTELPN